VLSGARAGQVEAVIVHGHMLREATLERRRMLDPNCDVKFDTTCLPVDPATMASSVPLRVEEVLVTQLLHRARLLDSQFQSEVVAVITQHTAPEAQAGYRDSDQPCGADTTPPSQAAWASANSLRHCGSRMEPSAVAENVRNRALWIHQSFGSGEGVQRGLRGQLGFSGSNHRSDLERSTTFKSKTWTEVVEAPSTSSKSLTTTEVQCAFSGGGVGLVEVHRAPVKTAERARDKLFEYAGDGAVWPLTACILDPLRAAVVCEGPEHMVEVADWFVCLGLGARDGSECGGGLGGGCAGGSEQYQGKAGRRLRACRVKNKFALERKLLVPCPICMCVFYLYYL
jgi:hypothetical protein